MELPYLGIPFVQSHIGRHISLSCVEVTYGICQQLSGFST